MWVWEDIMQTTKPHALWVEWKFRKEGTQMTLIWKNLLHANFRCGRMYSARAEKIALTPSCAKPSAARMCR